MNGRASFTKAKAESQQKVSKGEKEDSFDESFGPDVIPSNVYEEANDYDREIERPENSSWDDPSWPGFKKPFNELEKENLKTGLNEKALFKQIGEDSLGEEIRKAVDGKAGIQSRRDRKDLAIGIDGAESGWKGVQFGSQMEKMGI